MSILHAKIGEIDDVDFQQLIDELYCCARWQRDDSKFSSLWYLVNGIAGEQPNALSPAFLPIDGILTTKVGKLNDGIIYNLCLEIAGLKKVHLDDGKSVLSLLKLSATKLVRRNTKDRIDPVTRLIVQRRKNGDL